MLVYPHWRARVRMSNNITNVIKDVEKSFTHSWWNLKWWSHIEKQSGSSSGGSLKLMLWPSNFTLRYRPKRNKSMSSQKLVHPSSQQHCSRSLKVETIWMAISRWMDKHHVSSYKMEYRLTVRSNKVLVYTITWVNPSLFLKSRLLFYFIYFCLRWVFVSLVGLSLVVVSGGLLFIAVFGLLTAVTSLATEHRLQAWGLQESWHLGLAASPHVRSSQAGDRTHVT